jgi:hypothetical protein
LPGLLGGAAGLAPLSSLISVQPLGETGNPTPAWSPKVHVMLVVVALTATVPVLVLVTASTGHVTWLSWAGGTGRSGDRRGAGRLPRAAPQESTGRAGPRRLALRLTILPPGLPLVNGRPCGVQCRWGAGQKSRSDLLLTMYVSAVPSLQVGQLTCQYASAGRHSLALDELLRAPFATQSATRIDLVEPSAPRCTVIDDPLY